MLGNASVLSSNISVETATFLRQQRAREKVAAVEMELPADMMDSLPDCRAAHLETLRPQL
ncbi:hypothetical protein ColTof4_14370 [Colletotrichum tofieldiae]|nr:hypothetical protein ColTof4_14370 [Colletotrichum tofieldiae]